MSLNREIRYTVLKNKDIAQALDADEVIQLASLVEKVDTWRTAQGKPILECVVFESTWKQYNEAWELVEKEHSKF